MTTKRTCYQCDGEDLAEIQARRKEQIRAYAAADQAAADAHLVGVPGGLFEADLGDIEVQEIPTDQEVPTEEEAQAALDAKDDNDASDADTRVDATAMAAEEQGDPVTVADAEAPAEEPKEEVKETKAAPKKATAAKKEAADKSE